MLRRTRDPLKTLEKKLGYSFRRKRFLEQALVHRSFRFENPEVEIDNQRLEFLGDAALSLAAAARIYDEFEDSPEGVLTCMRSRLASGKALARIAEDLGLGDVIKLGKGEELSGGRKRASNLGDALEAIVGAAYLDGGMRAVDKIFAHVFGPELRNCTDDVWAENPKGRLQELSQRRWRNSPRYRSVAQKGPSHARLFTVEVLVNGEVVAEGKGKSKREAESQAAGEALRILGET